MKPNVLLLVLAMFVLLPLFRVAQAPGIEHLRTVDAVSLYASGVALGALVAVSIARLRGARA